MKSSKPIFLFLWAVTSVPRSIFSFSLSPNRIRLMQAKDTPLKTSSKSPITLRWATRADEGEEIFESNFQPINIGLENPLSFDEVSSIDQNQKPIPLYAWRALVLFVCIIWSTNFPVIKLLQSQDIPFLDPSMYASIRFSIAALILLPRTWGSWKDTDLLKGASLIGACKFLGYYGQSLGMLTSSANKGAFICSMNVVWVAFVSGFLYKRFKLQTWVSVVLAVIGIAFLELEGSTKPVLGDLWLLLQPIGFGTSYIFLERLMSSSKGSEDKETPTGRNAGAVTAFALITVAITSTLWAISQGHTAEEFFSIVNYPVAFGALIYTGVVTTAGAIWLQSIAFKNVPATDQSIILTTEPIFAAAFSAALLGEEISAADLIGGFLVILACLSNELNLAEKVMVKMRFQLEQWNNGGKLGKESQND